MSVSRSPELLTPRVLRAIVRVMEFARRVLLFPAGNHQRILRVIPPAVAELLLDCGAAERLGNGSKVRAIALTGHNLEATVAPFSRAIEQRLPETGRRTWALKLVTGSSSRVI